MLLWREKIPADWLPMVLRHLPAVLVDHAHLERKAATTALNLEKYRALYDRVEELNAIAIEELGHATRPWPNSTPAWWPRRGTITPPTF